MLPKGALLLPKGALSLPKGALLLPKGALLPRSSLMWSGSRSSSNMYKYV